MMSENTDSGLRERHEEFAKSAFNLTWDLLDKKDRTEQDDARMVHAAHASLFHWGEIGTPLHWLRGEWQISRVYSVLGRPQAAIRRAQTSLDLCEAHGIGDFDLTFAYEALARAHAVAGDAAKSQAYLKQAELASEKIEDEGNREYVAGELQTIAALLA